MNKIDKINSILELPEEVLLNLPRITVIGGNKTNIENYKNILKYENDLIKIETQIGNINIIGINLIIEQITNENLSILGKIKYINIE